MSWRRGTWARFGTGQGGRGWAWAGGFPRSSGASGAGPQFGVWMPCVSVELGLTTRAHFTNHDGLLGDMREATDRDIFPVYAGVVAAPLRFEFLDGWSVSVAELFVGTHLDPLGRTLRLQLGLVQIGWAP